MKTKAVLLLLMLMAVTLAAAQDSFRLNRSFKPGDKDTYKLHFSGQSQVGDLDVALMFTTSVDKLFDNGDAQLTSTVSDTHVTLAGNEVPAPAAAPTVVRVDKNGNPTEAIKGPQGSLELSRYLSPIFNRDLHVGDQVPIDQTTPDKTKVLGSVKVDSITDGVAKLVANVTVTPGNGDAPSKISFTAFYDVATSKLSRVEGTMDAVNLQGLQVTGVNIKLERVKS